MCDKTKNIIIAIGGPVILIIIFLINILSKTNTISISERRKLAQMPEISIENIKNGNISKEFEKYATDQFVARDIFRKMKSFIHIYFFRQKDNNDLFEKDGSIYKIEYPLNKNNLQQSLNKINHVYDQYLQNMNVYYAIIPDKNYYLENDDHLKMDNTQLIEISKDHLKQMQYIDITKSLSLKDYYKTDLHWKQENLGNVVTTIEKHMNLNNTQKKGLYEIKEMGDFYGAYFGQLGVNVLPDKLNVVSNKVLENCVTYNYEMKKQGKIYEKPKTADKYDIYLSGATPLITIDNPNATTEKELLLFRDSFGSSLAPLLVENYKKITLIDLRYMSDKLLENYITFNQQDVLFLYSALVLNQNIL